MRLLPALFFLAIAAGACNYFSARPVSRVDGVIAPDEPVQVNRSRLPSFSMAGFRVTPVADFSLQARVLSTERYYLGPSAELAPVDLALGWGPMSDSAVLARLRISQSDRFYFYRWSGAPPIAPTDIVTHSANMHMIPADDEIRKRLEQVRVGQVVALRGYLVRTQAPDGSHWNSSMVRTDSGSGACELVWVKEITVH
ncbi:MAG TPA: hypothetical protein VEP67_04085 [Thiobacillaceae bacterium]|nr:hypothetical protein [Thiobacillaceae bacterium]